MRPMASIFFWCLYITYKPDQSSAQVVYHLFYLYKLYEYDYRGLMVIVVVGWTKILWNCGSTAGWMIFFVVKIINTLSLLLAAFIKCPWTVFFEVWLASQTSWLELFSEPSRAGFLAVCLTSRAEPAH